MTLSIFGQYFNRNETWAEQARPWIDYLARNAFMLQQGRFAADIAYFYRRGSAADRALRRCAGCRCARRPWL